MTRERAGDRARRPGHHEPLRACRERWRGPRDPRLHGGCRARRGGHRGITAPAQTADLIDQLRATGTVLTYDPRDRTLHAGGHEALSVTIGKDH